MKKQSLRRALLASSIMAAFAPAQAQTQEAEPTAQVIVLGSRTQAKTALDTAVHVGLVNLKDMQSTGMQELPVRHQRPLNVRAGGLLVLTS